MFLVLFGRLLLGLPKLGVDVCIVMLMEIQEPSLALLATKLYPGLFFEGKLIVLRLMKHAAML